MFCTIPLIFRDIVFQKGIEPLFTVLDASRDLVVCREDTASGFDGFRLFLVGDVLVELRRDPVHLVRYLRDCSLFLGSFVENIVKDFDYDS